MFKSEHPYHQETNDYQPKRIEEKVMRESKT